MSLLLGRSHVVGSMYSYFIWKKSRFTLWLTPQLMWQPNILEQQVKAGRRERKRVIREELPMKSISDFSRPTLDKVWQLTLGIYRVKQVKSYGKKHTKN